MSGVEKLPAVNCLFHDVERAAEASFFSRVVCSGLLTFLMWQWARGPTCTVAHVLLWVAAPNGSFVALFFSAVFQHPLVSFCTHGCL